MDLLQLREKEVFEALKKIKKYGFVMIGGYAVNAHTLPRFSVDCDIVVENAVEAGKIGKELENFGYKEEKTHKFAPYHGEFFRYEKEIQKNFRVSFDILAGNVFDRNSRALFSAEWVFENSAVMLVKGKTIAEELKLRIINPDALIVMKFAPSRVSDIRDIFMLMPQAKDLEWIKNEASKRCNLDDRLEKIKAKIASAEFKNNLQGVYGYIDKKVFEKHKNAVLELG